MSDESQDWPVRMREAITDARCEVDNARQAIKRRRKRPEEKVAADVDWQMGLLWEEVNDLMNRWESLR